MADQFDSKILIWRERREQVSSNPHSSREDYERVLEEGSELLQSANRERNSVKESYQAAMIHLT
jgi:hypothetical protein